MTPEPPTPDTAPPARLCSLAVASLVLGLLSIGGGVIVTGLPAILCGHKARTLIGRASGWLRGGGIALAGLLCGYAGIALTGPAILAFVVPKYVAGHHRRQDGTLVQARRIYNACQAYASTRGSLPATLEELVPDFLPDAEPLRDPEHPEAGDIGYYYYGSGSKGTEPSATVFLAAKTEVRGLRVVIQFGGKSALTAFQPPLL